VVLTPEQQSELEALQAEASKPEPRTETGLAGLLHTVLDVVSGAVAHLPGEAWAALHSQVEHQLGEAPAESSGPSGGSSSGSSSSSSGSGKDSGGKGKASS
jgi:hypothetical protein